MSLLASRRVTAFLIASWQVGAIYLACAQSLPGQDAAIGTTKITSEPYRLNGRDVTLTLWRQSIPPLGDLELISYFKQHPEQTSFPNTAFVLVASDGKNLNQGSIVWIAYLYNDKLIRPQETWMADLARPIAGNQAYVAVVKSIAWDIEFRLYPAALGQNLGSFPIHLDPASYERWPKASEAASMYKSQLLGRDISGIAGIHAVVEAEGVTVHGSRELASTPPVAFHFDVKRKQWSRVDKPPEESGRPPKDEK
jgi:hypothetical protein